MVTNSPDSGLLITLPMTVDLMRLAASLEVKGGSRKLAKVLRTAWRTQSCLADLQHAQGTCDALESFSAAAASLEPAAILHTQSALLTTAILLYARATTNSSSKSNERGSIQLDLGKLTRTQQSDHDTLIRVRNSALGHVESGASIAGDYWHRDFLFAKRCDATNWQVASASTSIGFTFAMLNVLKRQLPVASGQLRLKCGERLEGAMNALRELKLSDADFRRYQVNPIEWFGSVEAAQMALAGNPGEELSAWTPLL